jgi:hypothetical protein
MRVGEIELQFFEGRHEQRTMIFQQTITSGPRRSAA